MAHDMIAGRFFLVGCPRSGTTLLQSLLAAHPDVASFPETHFFTVTARPWLSRLGFATPRNHERRRLLRFLDQIGRSDLRSLVPGRGLRLQPNVDAFIEILDRVALDAGATRWLEKTPRHLQFIPLIRRTVPDARFIHIVREGPGVVASMYAVTQQHPEAWNGARSIDACIARWKGDRAITQRWAGSPEHLIIRYEELIADPPAALEPVCAFMGIASAPQMLDQQAAVMQTLVLDDEPWKAAVPSEVRQADDQRFRALFSPEEQQYIRRQLHGEG